MYIPKYAQNDDMADIIKFIRQNSFGILVSQSDGKLMATHIPLQLSHDAKKLSGHISRANPQWKKLLNESEVMAIFSGPHAYISSSWYDHENVPTWNYIAAHVYGSIHLIDGDKLYESLKHLIDTFENSSEHPVRMESMSPEYIRKSMQGLVGFEIEITSIEATYKLSQNRDQKNHDNIIRELEKQPDVGAHQIAAEMKNRKF
ncbi:FMN-binding negative transcriptional regulator [Chryseolinea sp. H1M3-3]|uniref:FMN-binding negative transcriptional regulator n=1 Tax=Chryseolinea sp. H1M3-3 TaxID=3034144 RepID=UPI0023EC0822|nr:FMN-binding negative transcriptional regulator [Chryseolinea sp. H1M3-3]